MRINTVVDTSGYIFNESKRSIRVYRSCTFRYKAMMKKYIKNLQEWNLKYSEICSIFER